MTSDSPPPVRASVEVPVPPAAAWDGFIALDRWWPRAYTWSGAGLTGIALEPWSDGRCYEIGPDGLRLDWGRVHAAARAERLDFDWRIGPDRVPQPDPATASRVAVVFSAAGAGTTVAVRHDGFEKHGDGAADYAAALGSAQGWPYMLAEYQRSLG